MPTKRELLEEKTVKELKQMAKDENLSGYSTLRKSGLVDMISDNYTKVEIQSWPEEVEEEIEEAEEMIPEKAEEERIEEPEPTGLGMGELEEEPGITSEEAAVEREEVSTQEIIGIIIGVAVIIGVIIVLLTP